METKKKKVVRDSKSIKKMKEKNLERILCITFSVLAWIIIMITCFNKLFIPASTSMAALALFLVMYYYRDDKTKKIFNYILFSVVILLIIFTIGYTIIMTK